MIPLPTRRLFLPWERAPPRTLGASSCRGLGCRVTRRYAYVPFQLADYDGFNHN